MHFMQILLSSFAYCCNHCSQRYPNLGREGWKSFAGNGHVNTKYADNFRFNEPVKFFDHKTSLRTKGF